MEKKLIEFFFHRTKKLARKIDQKSIFIRKKNTILFFYCNKLLFNSKKLPHSSKYT